MNLNIIYSLIIFILVFIDYISKNLVFYFEFNFSFWIFKSQTVTNPGSALSIFENIPYYSELIIILTIALLVFIYFEIKKTKETDWIITYILIAAGALGNGIDRLIYGEVRDIIGIEGFAVINIADIYLTIAGAILIYIIIKDIPETVKQIFKKHNK